MNKTTFIIIGIILGIIFIGTLIAALILVAPLAMTAVILPLYYKFGGDKKKKSSNGPISEPTPDPAYPQMPTEAEIEQPYIEDNQVEQPTLLPKQQSESEQPLQQEPLPTPQPSTEQVMNAWTVEHDRIRKDVGLGPVTWNEQIASGAKTYAENCEFQHSDNSNRMIGKIILGENLSWGTPYSMYDDARMVQLWESEKDFYDHPQYPSQSTKGETGHYTQIVNKNVKEIGCGCARCNGAKMCVCRYSPIQYGTEYPY